MVPPAIAIPINPIAYATGPVSEVAIAVSGASQGRVPAADACALWVNTQARAAMGNRFALKIEVRERMKCIL
jgi:hypothetical protein